MAFLFTLFLAVCGTPVCHRWGVIVLRGMKCVRQGCSSCLKPQETNKQKIKRCFSLLFSFGCACFFPRPEKWHFVPENLSNVSPNYTEISQKTLPHTFPGPSQLQQCFTPSHPNLIRSAWLRHMRHFDSLTGMTSFPFMAGSAEGNLRHKSGARLRLSSANNKRPWHLSANHSLNPSGHKIL